MMAIRTTTTRTMSIGCGQYADKNDAGHADFSFADLVQAYFDCRKNKRNTYNSLNFEQQLERNISALYDDLVTGRYRPGKSICFVITRPKPREVWAADFRDRVVHHFLYNHIAPRFYASFIHDSCACIPGRGTLFAAKRLESKVRSITQNWSKPSHYLKCDLANFFVSIDKNILGELLAKKIPEAEWQNLTNLILWHDPRSNADMRSSNREMAKVPPHKSLLNQPDHLGLPIGNLSSQFFANIYLNELDQFIKHQIGARHYIRYVDDFVILHESPQWLNAALARINEFLPARLHAQLNPKKTILQPIARGIDFVGQQINPWHRQTRKRTRNDALSRIKHIPEQQLFETANSYFGLFGQASKSRYSRIKLANILRKRGYMLSAGFRKTFR